MNKADVGLYKLRHCPEENTGPAKLTVVARLQADIRIQHLLLVHIIPCPESLQKLSQMVLPTATR